MLRFLPPRAIAQKQSESDLQKKGSECILTTFFIILPTSSTLKWRHTMTEGTREDGSWKNMIHCKQGASTAQIQSLMTMPSNAP